jgi:dihydrodipicolinate synthase/N-acetylneuraminate lyase
VDVKLTGVLAPLPTPFDDEDRLDIARLQTALKWWVASPLTGFVVLGSNGEAVLMDDDECDRVVSEARAAVPRGRPLIVGTGRESTQAAMRASRRAAALGADAVLVRTPSFFKTQMTPDAFIRHYTAVAEASPVPVLLYNFTAVTGVNLLPATVARLAEHPNIIGMKESGSDISQISELVAVAPASFSVLAGSGTTFYAALCAGVSGGILALAALLPEPCVRLFELARQKQYAEARDLQQRLTSVARLISSTYGVPGLKAALTIVGCDVGRPRPPLVSVPETAVAALKDALTRFEEVRA